MAKNRRHRMLQHTPHYRNEKEIVKKKSFSTIMIQLGLLFMVLPFLFLLGLILIALLSGIEGK